MPTWIEFTEVERSPSGKTRRWNVTSREGGGLIGAVQWHAPWRKYCFFPRDQTVFEEDCLRDIAKFIEAATLEHKRVANELKGKMIDG
jgi:hypothetical protein